MKKEVIAYAMASIIFNNGICPFCKVKIAERYISLSDVEKHIEEKNEYSLWEKSYKRRGDLKNEQKEQQLMLRSSANSL